MVRHCEDEVRGNPQLEKNTWRSPRCARDDDRFYRRVFILLFITLSFSVNAITITVSPSGTLKSIK